MPETGVYFVNPLLIAFIAASLIKSGVSKSGSPAASAIISLPSALSFMALAVIARVGDSSIRFTHEDSGDFYKFVPNLRFN